MTAPRRAAAVLGVIGAVLLGLTARPAAADNHDLVVVFDAPGDGARLDSSEFAVTGRVEGRSGLVNTRVDTITVTLVREPGGTVDPIGNDTAPPEFAVRYNPPRNGRYTATVEATGKAQLLLLETTSVNGTASRSFGLAEPPRAPQDVTVETLPDGAVNVSWARNPEPDLLHYAVFRKDPGGASPVLVRDDVKQPASGRVSFLDRSMTVAGDYSYQVVAVREGADPGSPVTRATDAKSVTVATPPSSAPPAGAPGAPGDLTALRPDISTFLARPTPAATTAPRPLEIPDTGYSRDLPFGARPGEEMEPGEEFAEPRTFEVETRTDEFVSQGRPLVPVAGGAILLLLAAHLRLLNKRVKTAPATVSGRARTDLPVLDPRPFDYADGGYETDEPEPEPPEPPTPAAPVLFDYEEQVPLDDDEWAERDEVWEAMSSTR